MPRRRAAIVRLRFALFPTRRSPPAAPRRRGRRPTPLRQSPLRYGDQLALHIGSSAQNARDRGPISFTPLPKRREFDGEDSEPVIEVFARRPARDHLDEVAMGGRNKRMSAVSVVNVAEPSPFRVAQAHRGFAAACVARREGAQGPDSGGAGAARIADGSAGGRSAWVPCPARSRRWWGGEAFELVRSQKPRFESRRGSHRRVLLLDVA